MNRSLLGELDVFENRIALAQALADLFVDDARGAIAARERFCVALAGGTTPKAAYELLAQEPLRGAVDWKRVHIFFGDERCVPPTNEQSNYKSAYDAFLSKVPIPRRQISRMRGEDPPGEAAHAYARLLRETLGDPPAFDLVMLGMGHDGHTASLFPGSDPLFEDESLVRATYVEKLQTNRLTLTPRAINAARHVVIAAEGQSKAPALYAARRGPYDPTAHPVQIVAPAQGRLTWLVDKAAAAELMR